MQYPLTMKFKLLALSSKISITDASGKSLLFVQQKLLRLKEKVEVFTDSTRNIKIFDIDADRIIDWSASYHFTQADGSPWGAVRRKGAKSLWAATYEIVDENGLEAIIREESPMKKILESVMGEIPFVGFAAIYFLNPSYTISTPQGQVLMRLVKKPAVFEGRFEITKLAEIDEDSELRFLLSIIMLALLERRRG